MAARLGAKAACVRLGLRQKRGAARLGYAEQLHGSGFGSKARVSCSGRERGTTAAGGAARVAKGDATVCRWRRRGAWQESVEHGRSCDGSSDGMQRTTFGLGRLAARVSRFVGPTSRDVRRGDWLKATLGDGL